MKSNLRITATIRAIALCLCVCLFLSACGSADMGSAPETNTGANTETNTEDNGNVTIEQESVDKVGVSSEESEEVTTEPESVEDTAATQESETVEDTEVSEETESAEPESTETEDKEEVKEESEEEKEPEQNKLEKLWQNRLVANVKSTLNVRAEAKDDGKIVGKMERGAYAKVIEKGAEWTKISSGKVEGYVSTKYCLFGTEAMLLAQQLRKTVATVTTSGLRIREEKSTDSKIIKKLEEGDELLVNEKEGIDNGWVAIYYNEKTYYVSEQYVKVDVENETAYTLEELRAKEEKEQEKKEEEKKSKDKNSNKKVYANATDLELLTAMIYCEAGAESYKTQLAVASVIMNRVRSKKFPNTIRGVLFQKSQFGPASSGSLARRLRSGKVSKSCLKAAKAAMAGEDSTNGCLFFRDNDGSRKGKFVLDGMVFY